MRTSYIYPKEICDKSQMYMFKKTERLSGCITVRISALSRYKFFLNGLLVCEGPCQGSQYENHYEEIDITPFIKDNADNEFCIYVMHIADDKFSPVNTCKKPVLWLEGEQNGKIILQSNADWSISRLDNIELIQGDGVMFTVCPFEKHLASNIECSLHTEEGEKLSPDDPCVSPFGFLGMLRLKKSPLPQMKTHPAQEFVKIKILENGYVLDAGHYTTAKVKVKVKGNKGDILRLKYTECFVKSGKLWNSEDGDVCSLEKGIRDDISGKIIGPSDYIELNGNEQIIKFFWYRAFRFIEVTCNDISQLNAEIMYMPYFYPYEISAEFECSDERYNKMWETSIRTLLCCSHEIMVDCPFYEQQQYAMDSYLEAVFSLKLSNDTRIAKKVISDMAQSQQPNGLLCANYPARYVQIIPTFSIYWIMLIHDYYFYSADKEFAKKYLGTIEKILCAFDELTDENGLVKSAYWPYVDWAGNWQRGIPNGGEKSPIAVYSMQYSAGLKYAQALAEAFGRLGLAQDYQEKRTQLNATIKKHFWNGKKQYYNDTLITEEFSQHTAAWAILSELETGVNALELIKNMSILSTASCSFSMGYFMNRTYEMLELYNEIYNNFSGYFKMMDLHCTTWCENPDSPRSECHGWSATPLYEFPTIILGVKPTNAGFTKVQISPHIGELTYAKGKVPTPHGDIFVEWHKQGNKIQLDYKAPKEIIIDVKL